MPSLESLLQHREWVRALALRIVRDPSRADDVEQETWLTALRSPPEHAGAVRAWLARVVRCRALDAVRRDGRRRDRASRATPRDEEPAAVDVAARLESERLVIEAVQALPEDERAAVVLRYFEGLSTRAAARRLGVPYETLRARLGRAHERLRRRLRRTTGTTWGWAAPLVGARAAPRDAWHVTGGVVAMSSSKKIAVAAVVVLLLLGGGGAWWLSDGGGGSAIDERSTADGAAAASSASAAATRGGRTAGAGTSRGRRGRRVAAGSAHGPASGKSAKQGSSGPQDDEAQDPGGDGIRDAASGGMPVREPADDRDGPPRIEGTVVALGDGKPLGGGRALYAIVQDGRNLGWNGTDVEEDGTFEVNRPPDKLRPGQRYELWVSYPEYRMRRIPVKSESTLRIELERHAHAPLPGRITGIWTDRNGKPLSGVLLVEGSDAAATNTDQWTRADAAGRFVLEGVAPGYWRIAAYDVAAYGKRVETLVPEDGEVTVELRMRHTAEELVKLRAPITTEAYERRKKEIFVEISRRRKEGESWESAPLRRLMHELQTLEYRHRFHLPTRPVVVTGLPDREHAFVRAEQRARHYWRVRVLDGTARFDALQTHAWTLVLQVPGEDDVRKNVEVKAGAAPLTVDFGMGETPEPR